MASPAKGCWRWPAGGVRGSRRHPRWVLAIAVSLLAPLTGKAAPQEPPPGPAAPEARVQDLLAEGRTLWESGDFKKARGPLESAVALSEKRGDETSLAQSLVLLGSVVWGLGDYGQSMTLERRAVELSRRLGNAEIEAKGIGNVGVSLQSLGRYEEALDCFTQSVDAARRAHSLAVEGRAFSNIGIVHRFQGHYARAVESLEKALTLQQAAGDLRGVGLTLNQLGIVSRARGDYDQAHDYYRQSLVFRGQAKDRQGEAQTLNNIGNVYQDEGEPEAAIEQYARARDIAIEIGYTYQIGLSQQNIGFALESLGRRPEALPRYGDALDVFRRINRKGAVAVVLTAIGQLRHEALRDDEAARSALSEALATAREVEEPESEASALDALGQIALDSGSAAEALGRFDEALLLVSRVGARDLEYGIRADRARALRRLGRQEEAIKEFQASAGIVNDLRANVKQDLAKVGFLDRRQSVFADWVDALMEAGRDEEAFEAAEAGRARALADLLAQRKVRGKPRERDALEAFRTSLDELIAAARARPSSGPDSSGRAGDADAVDRTLSTVRSENRELASLLAVESPKLAEVRQLTARLGATVLEYFVTERALFAWVVDPEGTFHGARMAFGRPSCSEATQALREGIERADADALRHGGRLDPLLRKLDAQVVEPVARWLPASVDAPVIIVPHGPLALLPFAALLDTRGRSMADRHTLAFAASVSVLRYTSEKRAPLAAARRALIVADPRPPHGAGMPALTGTREEGRRVLARLGAGQAQLLMGEQATEAVVKRSAGDVALLHLATHGLVDPDRPLLSSLLFAEGEGEDGYLRADEIFDLDLRADLVVLSGCSTGLGKLTGDGILGLTRAFIYAGAASVVTSQWDVSDRATAFLMDRFYAELAAGRTKAAALRSAQLTTRSRFPHPALWAAFQLFGEP